MSVVHSAKGSRDSSLVEHRTRDQKVASSNSDRIRSDGIIFFSPELYFCADSYSVSVPPRVTAVARKRPMVILPKVQVVGYT